MATMMECALYYAKKGFSVFPLEYKGKRPIHQGGFKNATTDEATITEWWTAYPHANIGIATGTMSGNVFVIDLDVDEDKGLDGYHTLQDWERENESLPDTAQAMTGRGGYHMYFRSKKPVKSRAGILDGIDIRGDGGYVVAPPSVHKNGTTYEWEQTIEESSIADANEAVLKLLEVGEAESGEKFELPTTITSGKRNSTLFSLACSLQSKGLSNESIRACVHLENKQKCFPPIESDEVDKIVDSALDKEKGRLYIPPSREVMSNQVITLTTDKKGNVIDSIDNVLTMLREDELLAGKVRFNVLTKSMYIYGDMPWANISNLREWTDTDDSNLMCYLEAEKQLRNKDNIIRALDIVSHENCFNPIIEHLEALTWDGKPRVENMLTDYLGVEKTEYTVACMRLLTLGAISRIYKAGCKFDYMPVLVGGQGIGKSTFIRLLAIQDIWCNDNLNTIEGDKAVEKLRGMWFVELAELLATKRAKEVESIKAFITSTADVYRQPYSRRTEQRPRMCVFVGTTNSEFFLTDRTGNRRFLPLVCGHVPIKKSLFENQSEVRKEFDQMWAEALHIYKTEDVQLILPRHLDEYVKDNQKRFTEEDVRVGIIQEYLNSKQVGYRVCVKEVWTDALREIGIPTRRDSLAIHEIMQNDIVGWESVGKKKTEKYGSQICYEKKDVFQES